MYEGVSSKRMKATSPFLSIVLALCLLLNSGAVAAAQTGEEAEVQEDCPASFIPLGEELWDQIPDLPELSWSIGIPEKAKLYWKTFVLFLNSLFPGISHLLPKMPDLTWLVALLPGNWFEEDGLTGVPVIDQASGTLIGIVPVVGPVVDGIAIISGKDHVTGECLTRMGQGVLLASAGATLLFPALLVVKGGLKVGKPLANLLPDIPVRKVSGKFFDMVDEFKARVGWKVSRVVELNEVADEFRGMLRIVGKGSTSSDELARKMGLSKFTENNYREGLKRLTGNTSDEVKGFEAHHVLPREFEESFKQAGIENIHDPRLLVWVDEAEHKAWSHDYSKAWRTFFEENPDAKIEDVLEVAKGLSEDVGYKVLYETSGNWLTELFHLLW